MSEYKNPIPTVDIIIEIELEGPGGATGATGATGIVLIERKNEPRGWALPGGFVDEGEPLWRAAVREAEEETGLTVDLVEQFFSYSAPDRDPRKHTISTVFLARARGMPVGADDAARAQVFASGDLPTPLVFDHQRIVDDYLRYRDTGERPPPDR